MAQIPLAVEITETVENMLAKLSDSNTAVIVEGKKDKVALEKIGISGSRMFILNKKPLFAIAEEVASCHKEAVILTDLDEEGRRLYGKLNTLMQRLGVKVDSSLRNFLFRNTRLRQVEGITKLAIQQ